MCPWGFHMSLCSPLTSHEVCGSQSPASLRKGELLSSLLWKPVSSSSSLKPCRLHPGSALLLGAEKEPRLPSGFCKACRGGVPNP